jgi:hypothetical protein
MVKYYNPKKDFHPPVAFVAVPATVVFGVLRGVFKIVCSRPCVCVYAYVQVNLCV